MFIPSKPSKFFSSYLVDLGSSSHHKQVPRCPRCPQFFDVCWFRFTPFTSINYSHIMSYHVISVNICISDTCIPIICCRCWETSNVLLRIKLHIKEDQELERRRALYCSRVRQSPLDAAGHFDVGGSEVGCILEWKFSSCELSTFYKEGYDQQYVITCM